MDDGHDAFGHREHAAAEVVERAGVLGAQRLAVEDALLGLGVEDLPHVERDALVFVGLDHPAFQVRQRLGQAGRLHPGAGDGREARLLEFVDLAARAPAAEEHLPRVLFPHHVDGELPAGLQQLVGEDAGLHGHEHQRRLVGDGHRPVDGRHVAARAVPGGDQVAGAVVDEVVGGVRRDGFAHGLKEEILRHDLMKRMLRMTQTGPHGSSQLTAC
jgi:hypothetical protein